MYFSSPEYLPCSTVPLRQHEVLVGPGWQRHSCFSHSASFRCWSEPKFSFSGTPVPLLFSAIWMLSTTWLSSMNNSMALFLPLKLQPTIRSYLNPPSVLHEFPSSIYKKRTREHWLREVWVAINILVPQLPKIANILKDTPRFLHHFNWFPLLRYLINKENHESFHLFFQV